MLQLSKPPTKKGPCFNKGGSYLIPKVQLAKCGVSFPLSNQSSSVISNKGQTFLWTAGTFPVQPSPIPEIPVFTKKTYRIFRVGLSDLKVSVLLTSLESEHQEDHQHLPTWRSLHNELGIRCFVLLKPIDPQALYFTVDGTYRISDIQSYTKSCTLPKGINWGGGEVFVQYTVNMYCSHC